MAGPHTYYAYADVPAAGTSPDGARDIIPLREELRRFNATFSHQLR